MKPEVKNVFLIINQLTTMKKTFTLFFVFISQLIVAQTYQNETYINGTTFGDKISSVRLNQLYNSFPDFPPYYFHYTGAGRTATLIPGIIYYLEIQTGANDSTYYSAFIDFNDDGDFSDEGENVMQAINNEFLPYHYYTQKIKIPATATADTLRLRVICTAN